MAKPAYILMTKTLRKRFAEIGRQDKPDAIVIAKYFNPGGAGTWYATEFDGDDTFFGYVTGLGCNELGSFSLSEMEAVRNQMGLPLERDLYWTETTLDKIMEKEP